MLFRKIFQVAPLGFKAAKGALIKRLSSTLLSIRTEYPNLNKESPVQDSKKAPPINIKYSYNMLNKNNVYSFRTLSENFIKPYDAASAFKEYSAELHHELIAGSMLSLSKYSPDLDQVFWEKVFPYAKAVVMEINRNSIESAVDILQAFSLMNVSEKETWATAHDKLLKENIIRYVPLPKLGTLFSAFARSRKGSESLYTRIEEIMNQNIIYFEGYDGEKIANDLHYAYKETGRKVP